MWNCPNCKSEVDDDESVDCWNCDYTKLKTNYSKPPTIAVLLKNNRDSDGDKEINKLNKRRVALIVGLPFILLTTLFRSGAEILPVWFSLLVVVVFIALIVYITYKIQALKRG
jgi:hypothetical protein